MVSKVNLWLSIKVSSFYDTFKYFNDRHLLDDLYT